MLIAAYFIIMITSYLQGRASSVNAYRWNNDRDEIKAGLLALGQS